MEEGIFADAIARLTTLLYANTDLRTLPQLTARANALGLPVREDFTAERVLFTVAQAVANLLDEMVSPEGDLRRRRLEEGEAIEGHSTLNSAPNCLAGNLHIAALVFSVFCPRMTIWSILEEVSRAREELSKEDAILEDVRLSNRIQYLPNLRSTFTCHCLIFSEEPHLHPSHPLTCTCNAKYHGECQFQPLLCNSCFLRFCLFDLREQLTDPYSKGKQVELAYFSYLESAYSHPHPPTDQCIYFHVARFDLPDLNNVEKKEKAFYLKLAIVDRIFRSQLESTVRGRRREVRDYWQMDGIQYSFYLNHNEVRISSYVSDYAVIFKLLSRQLFPFNNILVIKCIKRNYHYATQEPVPYWVPPLSLSKSPPVIMLGVYQTNKVKINKTIKPPMKVPFLSKNVLPELNIGQSISYLEYVLKQVNRIEYQIVDLIDINSGEKIVNPVRSYSCTHLQCFDFEEYKHKVKPNNTKPKAIKKEKIPIDLDQDDEPSNVIDLDSNSVILVDVAQTQPSSQDPNPMSLLKLTPLQRKKQYLKRRRQKERREKREKDSLFCPICSRRMLALYTDPLFKSILLNSGFYTKVKVFSNGQFHFQEQHK